MEPNRYSYKELLSTAEALLTDRGVPAETARMIAETLAEADLMGHSTHGLALLPAYLRELKAEKMKASGEPRVLSDAGAAVVWDGEYLNGVYLTRLAVKAALERSEEHPVVTFVIRRAHHIACLAAYMPEIVEAGRIGILMASDPSAGLVAPFGGKQPIYTPNPVAAGVPAGPGGPLILDVSMSVTAAGVVNRHKNAGTPLPNRWLLTKEGEPTDNPEALGAGGSILPLGGLDAGYKGYALGLLVEALTSGLAGYGRPDQPTTWGTSVYLQVVNPAFFGGGAELERQMGWLNNVCRKSTPRPGHENVRVPGDRALALKEEQLRDGVRLSSPIVEGLEASCAEAGVAFPEPLSRGVEE